MNRKIKAFNGVNYAQDAKYAKKHCDQKTLSVLRAFACPVKFRKAEILAKQIETEAIPSVTTRAVVLEIGNALARLRYRVAAIDLLDSLEQDPGVEIIPL